MSKLLVVDDEPNVLYSLRQSLQSDTVEVLTADTGRQALELARCERPDVALVDIRLGDMSGLDVFDRIHQADPRLPVILITAFATTEVAIEAMKRGAFEYLLKPVDLHQLREVIGRAIEQSRLTHVPPLFEEEATDNEEGRVDRIIGRSSVMQEVYKAIGRIAPQDVTVLIVGESGTGKELVARALYHHSRRSQNPFLAMNCAAIPEALLESELFGHERGAFTGADRRRIGKFEQADQGTLFLDEIGDMTSPTQAKVLRLLQEQRFERLGGNETIQTNVRVIAATNQNLEEAVAAGRFRQDLFYRLNGFTIRLPPLRERQDDIPLLIEHFIRRIGPATGTAIRAVSPTAMAILQAHSWPGNVRELQSAMRFALVHARGDVITPDCLPQSIRESNAAPAASRPSLPSELPDLAELVQVLLRLGESDIYRKVCLEADRVILGTVMEHVRGNQVQASELLGISRTTLRARLRAMGMAVEKHLLTETGQCG